MMAKQEVISFMRFKNLFDIVKDACRKHLFKMRWPEGFQFPRCGHQRYYLISTRNRYKRKTCHYQESVTVGTVMEKTHIQLEKWFWDIYLVGRDKRGCSATLLSRELELS